MSLNQTVSEVMNRSVSTVELELPIAELRNRELVDFTVVQNAGGEPIGLVPKVLLETTLAVLPEFNASVSILRSHFIIPAVTSASTELRTIVEGVRFEGTARWHVVMGSGVVGVLTPETIYENLALTLPTDHTLFSFGVPLAPPSMCLRCDDLSGVHRVRPKQAPRDVLGNYLCPKHSTVLQVENPCAGTVP